MTKAWIVLIISAITDIVITSGTAITSAMVATGSAQIPSDAVILLAIIGGLVAGARTIQQELKASIAAKAEESGSPAPRV